MKTNVPFTVLAIGGVLAPAVALFIVLISGGALTNTTGTICLLLAIIGIVFGAGALTIAGIKNQR